LSMVVSVSLSLGAVGATLDQAALARTAWRIVVGTTLLTVDVVLVMMIYNQLTRLTLPFVLRVFTALGLVCVFDTLLYEALAGRSPNFWSEVMRHSAGKLVVSGLYTLMIWAYLRTAEQDFLSPWLAQRTDRDLFAMLTYRERFERLASQVIRDPLTGVFNRLYLDTRLPEQIALEKRRQAGVAVLMVDIDYFKSVNDTYGHAGGDEALRHVARVLEANVRRGDIVCRYGGEEFVIILPGAKRREAMQVAEHVVAEVARRPVTLNGSAVGLTVTVGVAAAPIDGRIAAEVLARADQCLYEGKRTGRNRVVGPLTIEPNSQLVA
jgi:diguanylate cyclase (GGDEF)-like protein